jgi:hypothetical protein
LVGNPEGKGRDYSENLVVDERIILKWIQGNRMIVWTGYF